MKEPLHVQVTEPPKGPCGTIVAVPGLAESAATLAPPARHWAQAGWRVLAIDPRGHGLSPRWTPQHLAGHPGDVVVDDLRGTLAARNDLIRPLAVFGHSAGGSAAAALAVDLPGVIAVVLEDPFWRLPVTRHQDRDVARAAAALLARQQAQTDEQRRADAAGRWPRWQDDEWAAWSIAKAQTDPAIVANGDIIPSVPWPDLLDRLRLRQVPVLVVTGTVDIGMTREHQRTIRERGAELVTIQDASHFVRRDQPAAFARVVDDFLAVHAHAPLAAR